MHWRSFRTHALWLWLFSRGRALSTIYRGDTRSAITSGWHCCTSSQRRVFVCHLIWIDFSKSLRNSLSLVQFAEDSIQATSSGRCRSRSIVKSHWWWGRSWWRRWGRRSTSRFGMRSRRERLALFHSFDGFFSRNPLRIPGNALRESLFDIFCEILEDLVV